MKTKLLTKEEMERIILAVIGGMGPVCFVPVPEALQKVANAGS